jgi:hypothetical protein
MATDTSTDDIGALSPDSGGSTPPAPNVSCPLTFRDLIPRCAWGAG